MTDVGFNDNLEIAGRTFHIQTATSAKRGSINCEIFENGRVLFNSVLDFERRNNGKSHLADDRLKNLVESLHQDMLSEIELLFTIAEKVKKLKHSPSNTKIGKIFLQNNLVNDAIEQFELAIENDPDYLDANKNLGMTYIQVGEYDKAAEILAKALDKETRFADLHNSYGFALMMTHHFNEAVSEFQKALRINQKYLEVHYNLSVLYLKSTIENVENDMLPSPAIRIQRCREQLDKLKLTKIKTFEIIYHKTQKLISEKHYEEAVKYLEENRSIIFPKDTLGLICTNFYLKYMYGGKGLDNNTINKYEEILEDALTTNKKYADIWNNLGVIHLVKCRNLFIQALSEFKRSLELNPNYEKAKKNKILVENDGKEFLTLLRAILK